LIYYALLTGVKCAKINSSKGLIHFSHTELKANDDVPINSEEKVIITELNADIFAELVDGLFCYDL
jgi:hypothetical protein